MADTATRPTKAPKRVRMVRCVYIVNGENPWVPMGRSRTRCPRCGAEVGGSSGHPVEMREPSK